MPVIGYNLNIPAANNNPSQDQPLMQTNTNAINTLLSLDHFTFADNAAGRHKQVSLTDEAAPGIPGNSNSVLFSNLDTGNSWPFWQNALGVFNLMGPQVTGASGTNGYAWIGGILFNWGNINFAGGLSHETSSYGFVTVPNIVFPNACFLVIPSLKVASSTETVAGNTIAIRQIGTTSFTWVFNSDSSTGSTRYPGFRWLAIGN